MECSCRLCPIPGMYVVTSMLFVRRALATLRSAELGFFGVCVYTRMHTPRFSGHPCSAGDFVFVRTFSRPLRTSCANVGTALPQFEQNFDSIPGQLSPTRGVCGFINRRGSVATPADRQDSHAQNPLRRFIRQRVTRRCSLGFAGLAPHSGRSPSPVPLTALPEQETYPFYDRA